MFIVQVNIIQIMNVKKKYGGWEAVSGNTYTTRNIDERLLSAETREALQIFNINNFINRFSWLVLLLCNVVLSFIS